MSENNCEPLSVTDVVDDFFCVAMCFFFIYSTIIHDNNINFTKKKNAGKIWELEQAKHGHFFL